MDHCKHRSAILGLGIVITLLALLSACIPSFPGSQDATATPRKQGTRVNATPTPVMAGYEVVATPQACSAKVLKSIKTNLGQGNLFAWSPDGSRLAWIEPTEAHQWYAGTLLVASGPDFTEPVMLAQNVAGSLIWSPDGDSLAFSVLRVSEGVYTIMSINIDGTDLKDLFPGQAARLDSFTSPKAITTWNTPGRLSILAECGSGCLKSIVVDPASGVILSQTDGAGMESTSVWRPRRNQQAYAEDQFPVMVDPNQSEDGTRIVYFDEKGYLWVLLVTSKQAFRIEIENYTPIFINQEGNHETHWSLDNRLGVRLDDRIEIFAIPCAQ